MERSELFMRGATITVEPFHSLELVVTDEADNPITDVKARLTAWYARFGGYGGEGLTDTDGRVVLDTLMVNGSYGLWVSKEGYYHYDQVRLPTVGSEDWKDKIEISLKKADIARGRVVDENGNPLKDASVVINTWYKTYAKTGDDGEFEIEVPMGDNLGYEPGPSGLVPARVPISAMYLPQGTGIYTKINRETLLDQGITLTPRPPHTLKITVIDQEGNPLPHLVSHAYPWFGDFGEGGSVRYADQHGQCEHDDIYEGVTYRISVTLGGYYSSFRDNLHPAENPEWKSEITIVMERTDRTQKGRVVNEAGEPVAEATINAYFTDGIATTSDSDGRFELSGLPYSKISIRAEKDTLSGWADISKDTDEIEIIIKERKQVEPAE